MNIHTANLEAAKSKVDAAAMVLKEVNALPTVNSLDDLANRFRQHQAKMAHGKAVADVIFYTAGAMHHSDADIATKARLAEEEVLKLNRQYNTIVSRSHGIDFAIKYAESVATTLRSNAALEAGRLLDRAAK